jgi:hypothetical protein
MPSTISIKEYIFLSKKVVHIRVWTPCSQAAPHGNLQMGEIYLQRKRVKEQKHLNGTSSLKLKQNEQGRPFRGWKIVQYKCNWYVVISEKANDSLSLYIYK